MKNLHYFAYTMGMLLVLSFILGIGEINESKAQDQYPNETPMSLSWSHDGEHIAIGQRDGQIIIQDTTTNRASINLMGHTDSITSLDWSDDGTQLVSSSIDNTARIWGIEKGESRFVLQHVDWVTETLWRPKTNHVITGMAFGDNSLSEWDASTGNKLLGKLMGTVGKLVWSPDGTRLLAANPAGAVNVIDGTSLELLHQYLELEDLNVKSGEEAEENNVSVISVAWHPDGNSIASGNALGQVRVRDVSTGAIVLDLRATDKPMSYNTSHFVLTLGFSHDGAYLQSITADGTIRQWDVKTGAVTAETDAGLSLSAARWSPYLGRIAYGTLQRDAEAKIIGTPELQIIAPFASVESLQTLAAACIEDAPNREAASDLLQVDASLTQLIADINALPEDVIPRACAVDVLAVAEVLEAQ